MTRMASYEDNEGRKNTSVAKHFRSDYVGLEVVKAIICATIAYMIVCGVYLYYDFEELMVNIYKNISDAAEKVGKPGNLVVGANVAGFIKVADAMLAQGIAY